MTASFTYTAVDAAGSRCRGTEEAPTAEALISRLAGRGLVVIRTEAADAADLSPGAKASGGGSRREVLEVTRALAALLPAGLPLARALGAAGSVASGEVAAAVLAVKHRIERGESLATALADHPALFPPVYVGLVRAGERSGDLSGSFVRLAGQLEREEQLRARLVSASIYPLLLAAAGGIAVIVLLLFVIPRFVELLEGTGASLPRSTMLVLGLSNGLRRFWPALLALPLIGAVAIGWWRRTDGGRRSISRLVLGVPFIAGLRRQALGARLARLLGVLLSGGTPLLPALDETIACLTDPVAREDAERVRAQVREGVPLHRALASGRLYPRLLDQLVAVGEESGRLPEFLVKAADILEERTERGAQRLASLAEPAMIVVFGSLVGFVALSLLQAIYGVNAGAFR